MTKNVIYLIIILVVLSCQSKKYSKENLIYSKEITTDLFVEKYKTYAGSATTSDSYSYYITDSIKNSGTIKNLKIILYIFGKVLHSATARGKFTNDSLFCQGIPFQLFQFIFRLKLYAIQDG